MSAYSIFVLFCFRFFRVLFHFGFKLRQPCKQYTNRWWLTVQISAHCAWMCVSRLSCVSQVYIIWTLLDKVKHHINIQPPWLFISIRFSFWWFGWCICVRFSFYSLPMLDSFHTYVLKTNLKRLNSAKMLSNQIDIIVMTQARITTTTTIWFIIHLMYGIVCVLCWVCSV